MLIAKGVVIQQNALNNYFDEQWKDGDQQRNFLPKNCTKYLTNLISLTEFCWYLDTGYLRKHISMKVLLELLDVACINCITRLINQIILAIVNTFMLKYPHPIYKQSLEPNRLILICDVIERAKKFAIEKLTLFLNEYAEAWNVNNAVKDLTNEGTKYYDVQQTVSEMGRRLFNTGLNAHNATNNYKNNHQESSLSTNINKNNYIKYFKKHYSV